MRQEHRKSPRRALRYTAWVARKDVPRIACLVVDVSETGARLEIKDAAEVPEYFSLILSGRGTAHRECKVVWRKPDQVGVRFLNQKKEAEDSHPMQHDKLHAASLVPDETPAPAVPTEPAENS